MQQPAYRAYRKAFKGRIGSGYDTASKLPATANALAFGQWGLRAIEGGRLTARQIEAARRALRRGLDREGVIWSRRFPDIPVSGKPSEVRRGKGKGAVVYWATRIRPGHILFEVGDVSNVTIATAGLRSARQKLPRRCRIVERQAAVSYS